MLTITAFDESLAMAFAVDSGHGLRTKKDEKESDSAADG